MPLVIHLEKTKIQTNAKSELGHVGAIIYIGGLGRSWDVGGRTTYEVFKASFKSIFKPKTTWDGIVEKLDRQLAGWI